MEYTFEPVGAVVEHHGKKVCVVEDDFKEKDMYAACWRCAFLNKCNDIRCASLQFKGRRKVSTL